MSPQHGPRQPEPEEVPVETDQLLSESGGTAANESAAGEVGETTIPRNVEEPGSKERVQGVSQSPGEKA
jgi:hypothetical protein